MCNELNDNEYALDDIDGGYEALYGIPRKRGPSIRTVLTMALVYVAGDVVCMSVLSTRSHGAVI